MNTATAMPTPDEPLWTAQEVATYLRVSLSTVYNLRRAGDLPVVQVGSLYRFHPEAVRGYARGERPAPGAVIPLGRPPRRRV